MALGAYMGYMTTALESIHRVGFLMHQWDITLEQMIYMNSTFINSRILFALTFLFTKLAILLEWLRIFNPAQHRNYFFWVTWGMIGANVTFCSLAIFLLAFACRPFEKHYNPFVDGSCFDSRPLAVVSAVLDVVLGIGILVLPQQIIWRLQMSPKRKFGIGIVFAFGLLTILCAIYRVPATIKWISSADSLYAFCLYSLGNSAEMTCGLGVFCIPSIPKAFIGLGLSQFSTTFKLRLQFGRENAGENLSSDQNDYHMLRGDLMSLQTIGGSSKYKLRQHTKPKHHLDNSILRTTQFTAASTEALNNEPTQEQFRAQHPWVDNP
ncbi:hypothetical protein F4806DRAFT_503815 [Annulohypoxylon nitens]|nr:hypothetical protein F4806DRAFT_503815 [Annulohypoxylon nitens]